MPSAQMSVDQICQHFTDYLFEHKANVRHVRRVAAWIGMLVLAIEWRKDEWQFLRSRQFAYRVGQTWYKVRYQHSISNRFNRGGIEIVEMIGNSDGPVAQTFTSVHDVEKFYMRSMRKTISQAA